MKSVSTPIMTTDRRTLAVLPLIRMNDCDLCLEIIYSQVSYYVTFAIEYLGKR